MSTSINGAFKGYKRDNLCTPRILVECLKPYFLQWIRRKFGHDDNTADIPTTEALRRTTVWCPFDKETSEYVLFFRSLGCKVIATHIDDGYDFFEYEPEEQYDIIISNPPFSRKLDVFKRCHALGKPWVMLSNMMCLNYMEIGNHFAYHPVQMIIPDKRVSFDGNPSSFCSGYFCNDFLKIRDLEFCHLPHCNSGKDFVPSRMLEDVCVKDDDKSSKPETKLITSSNEGAIVT